MLPAIKDNLKNRKSKAFTLVEVLISMLILGIMIAGIVGGYMQAHKQAEWSAYSLAANALALQPIEQSRAAKWDLYRTPPSDQVTNLPAITTNILDIPINGTNNIVYATNRTTVRTISTAPPLKEIRVECTWRFMNRGIFTNSIVTYRAPDQ